MATRDPRTGHTLPPVAQPGYYPGFSTLAQKPSWDEATQKVVEARVKEPGPLKFFTEAELPVVESAFACLMPQSDRDLAHQIPLVWLVDQKLTARHFKGYIYAGTVEDDEAYRLGLPALDQLARQQCGDHFARLGGQLQEKVLLSMREGVPWSCQEKLPSPHFWNVMLEDAFSAYYSHPWAWDEVGFGGPAYPRGYMRLINGQPEPWEKDEQRYEWSAPAHTMSDLK